jgi:hypothetical protein
MSDFHWQAESYIRNIRNTAKKSYARLYWDRLVGGTPEDGGELAHYGLGEMAAQAVRMRLDAIYNGAKANAAGEYMRHNTPPSPGGIE